MNWVWRDFLSKTVSSLILKSLKYYSNVFTLQLLNEHINHVLLTHNWYILILNTCLFHFFKFRDLKLILKSKSFSFQHLQTWVQLLIFSGLKLVLIKTRKSYSRLGRTATHVLRKELVIEFISLLLVLSTSFIRGVVTNQNNSYQKLIEIK